MMTPPEVEQIATKAAEKAVTKLLVTLGVNAAEPESIVEMQKDFAHIRKSRLAFAAMETRAYLVVTGTVVTGIITAIWMALRGNGH